MPLTVDDREPWLVSRPIADVDALRLGNCLRIIRAPRVDDVSLAACVREISNASVGMVTLVEAGGRIVLAVVQPALSRRHWIVSDRRVIARAGVPKLGPVKPGRRVVLCNAPFADVIGHPFGALSSTTPLGIVARTITRACA